MTLGDVIDQLKYGELRSIAIKDDNFAITSYVNLALQALYNKFTLKVSEQTITVQDGVTDYKLNSDVMTILFIYDENKKELPIDDRKAKFPILQVDYETLYIPNIKTDTTINIVYKISPATVVYTDTTSLSQQIPLPSSLLEPLLHYVGYRAHGSINGDIKAENNTHYMRFVRSCEEIEKLGLIRKAIPTSSISLQEGISESTFDTIKGLNNGNI